MNYHEYMTLEARPIELPSPESIIEVHGLDALVQTRRSVTGEHEKYVPLGGALAAEEAFCTADDVNRKDPYKRATFLLGILASGNSLNEQYYPLLEPLFKVPS